MYGLFCVKFSFFGVKFSECCVFILRENVSWVALDKHMYVYFVVLK